MTAGNNWDPSAYLRGSMDAQSLSVAPANMNEMQEMVVCRTGSLPKDPVLLATEASDLQDRHIGKDCRA